MAVRQPLPAPPNSIAHMKRAMRENHRSVSSENFSAATTSNATYSWTRTPIPINEIIRRTLTVLRARSREQYQRNDYARKFIQLLKTNVVGPTGFAFEGKVVNRSGKADIPANDLLESSYTDWARRHCSLDGRLDYTDLSNLQITETALEGSALFRIYRGKQFGKWQFQLQPIDPELLYVHYNDELSNGNQVRMGIEYDQYQRPVAYHLRDLGGSSGRAGGNTSYYYNNGEYLRVPANEIIHSFVTESAGQQQGLPWMATPMFRMNQLNGYEESAVINARAGANKMGFYKNVSNPLAVATQDPHSGELIEDGEPGHWSKLPAGIEIEPYDPVYPHEQYGTFVKSCLRGIAAGLGVAYHTLANDLEGVNYSSGRLGEADQRDVWVMLQEWQVKQFHRRVYDAWLDHQLDLGSLRINGSSLLKSMQEKYQEVRFTGRRWVSVDPAKDADANQSDIDNNLNSVSNLIRQRTNRDPDEVFLEIQAEQARFKELGIEVVKKDPAAKPPKKAKPEDANGEKT